MRFFPLEDYKHRLFSCTTDLNVFCLLLKQGCLSGQAINAQLPYEEGLWFESGRRRPTHPVVEVGKWLFRPGEGKVVRRDGSHIHVMVATSPSSVVTGQRKYEH